MGLDDDSLDIVKPVLDEWMERHGSLDRGLCMKLCGEGDLEQDVLHDIGAKRLLQLYRFAVE